MGVCGSVRVCLHVLRDLSICDLSACAAVCVCVPLPFAAQTPPRRVEEGGALCFLVQRLLVAAIALLHYSPLNTVLTVLLYVCGSGLEVATVRAVAD